MGGVYGVIGDPIAQSLSPLIHCGWLRELGIDADYRAFHVLAGTLRSGLATLERDGVRGLNVTAPHKIDVAALCERVTPLAETLRAVNTLSRTEAGGWVGHNTDYQGFLDDFALAQGGTLEPCPVLVLGAGGAAQAVARALNDRGFGVVIANRTAERAVTLAETLGLSAKIAHGLDDLDALSRTVNAVVNTLSSGHSGDTVHIPAGNRRLFYDISYGNAAKGTLDAAASSGWRVADGLGMLVGQAALSFEIWHGQSPDRGSALQRCRTALEMTT